MEREEKSPHADGKKKKRSLFLKRETHVDGSA